MPSALPATAQRGPWMHPALRGFLRSAALVLLLSLGAFAGGLLGGCAAQPLPQGLTDQPQAPARLQAACTSPAPFEAPAPRSDSAYWSERHAALLVVYRQCRDAALAVPKSAGPSFGALPQFRDLSARP